MPELSVLGFSFLSFFETVSLCSSAWPPIHNPPASTPECWDYRHVQSMPGPSSAFWWKCRSILKSLSKLPPSWQYPENKWASTFHLKWSLSNPFMSCGAWPQAFSDIRTLDSHLFILCCLWDVVIQRHETYFKRTCRNHLPILQLAIELLRN
jgi:hypothetical protein